VSRSYVSDGSYLLLSESVDRFLVVSQIELSSNEDLWDVGAVVSDFWDPLGANVFERIWGDQGETNDEDLGLWVGERSETIVIFLTCASRESKKEKC